MAGKVISNLEQLAEGIGSYLGMMDGLSQDSYVSSLLEQAHRQATPAFDKFIAGMAMRDKSLSHMWEFGTAGITRGTVKFGNPTSPTARLYVHTLTGPPTTKTVGFVFRPAKTIVAPLIEEETGAPQSILNLLAVNSGKKRYKFPNKAFIYESGAEVSLVAKRTKRLFIPVKQEGVPNSYKGDPSRGYVWAESHRYSPGQFADSVGRFTGSFAAWWTGPGAVIMTSEMMKSVEKDLIAVDKTIKPSKRMNAAKAGMIRSAVKKGQSKTRKQWTVKTRPDIGERAEVIL